MGLRDAIDAGRNEIRTTAESVIESLRIEKQIKEAVVQGRSSISVEFKQHDNMYVIQEEVIRQISAEGFTVKWEKSCCPNTYITSNPSSTQRRCIRCKAEFNRPYPRNMFGHITISWDLSNQNHSKNDFNKGSL
jgi:hypothetical protein